VGLGIEFSNGRSPHFTRSIPLQSPHTPTSRLPQGYALRCMVNYCSKPTARWTTYTLPRRPFSSLRTYKLIGPHLESKIQTGPPFVCREMHFLPFSCTTCIPNTFHTPSPAIQKPDIPPNVVRGNGLAYLALASRENATVFFVFGKPKPRLGPRTLFPNCRRNESVLGKIDGSAQRNAEENLCPSNGTS